MAEGVTNLNTPPPPDQKVVDVEQGALGRLAEKWRAWFTALGEVTNWHVTGDLDVDGDAVVDGALTAGSISTGVGGIMGSNPLLHVQHQAAAGTNGGNFTQAAWRTRPLTIALTSQITGSGLALAPAVANQVLLAKGTYNVHGWAVAYQVTEHKAKLRDITGAADLIIGESARAAAADSTATNSRLEGQITLAVASVIELQHFCNTTKNVDGFGIATNVGVVEVFADLWFEQLVAA